MSSDGFYEDDFDEETLNQLNEIEAKLAHPPARPQATQRSPSPIMVESSDYGDSFDLDDEALKALDAIEQSHQAKPRQFAPPPVRTSSRGTLQTTLFGEVLPREPSTSRSSFNLQGTRSKHVQQEPQKSKQWDHTSFAKTGVKSGKKGKGKEKQREDGDDDEEEEEFQFEQFPAPFVSRGPPPPMKVQPDLLEAKHWIYPLNRPKRDYQFEIVKNSLFENTIVALPTGLGKTFIAGVVMLNYYRWFPEGKVVFVAPTKPLVTQQVEACHDACGIPGSDAMELTGQIPKATRNKYWSQKRVFYATPQTLINDLMSENCDVRDIVLIVIDEAHRATGDYAYNQVIRWMMAKNPHFRVLALTATPGSNREAVQTLIDGLHISRIEIRNERELARFSHEKRIEQHIIRMTPDINKVKDLIVKLMDHHFKPVAHIWRGSPNLARMHPFSAQAQANDLKQGQRHLYGAFQVLQNFARFLGYLMEGTIKMCYDELEQYTRDPETTDGMKPSEKAAVTRAQKIRSSPLFLNIMNEVRAQNAKGFSVHPKMEKMKTLIVQHFGARMSEDGDPESGEGATKAMVFVTYRAAVDEIVEVLNAERPLLRATAFIGQGTDKKGKKGLAQREQLAVIQKFKDNEYNVLVATSIGEEGLDIGEVDLAICYDTQKTPIRLLQRLGRTGRKRSGHVHVLLAEGREELNFDKAQSSYEDVQASIIHGSHLEFYSDVERLLPDHIQPQCLEKEMEIFPYVREEPRRKLANSPPKKGAKRKRNDDIGRNIPLGASTGFVSVAELLVKEKGKKNKKIHASKNFESLGTDDEDDRELATGLSGISQPPLKKSKSTTDPKSKASTSGGLRKSKTLNSDKPKKTKKGKGKQKEKEPDPAEWTASQFQAKGADDSDDMEIQNGILPKKRPSIRSPTSSFRRSSSELAVMNGDADVIDLTDSDHGGEVFGVSQTNSHLQSGADFEQPFETPPKSWSQSPQLPSPRRDDSQDMSLSWVISDDEDNMDIDIVKSSPVAEGAEGPVHEPNSPTFPSRSAKNLSQDRILADDSVEFVDLELSPPPPSQIRNTVSLASRNSPPPKSRNTRRSDMPPPALPVQYHSTSAVGTPQGPELSFAVRPARKRQGQSAPSNTLLSDDSPVQMRRLHRRQKSSGSDMSPPPLPLKNRSKEKTKKRQKRPQIPAKYNPLYDYAAVHSGDEVSEGSSGSEDVESESDRIFLEEPPETQASPSYDQGLAYRQSLMTQAPGGGPLFAHKPLRRGQFGRNSMRGNERREGVSSSPPVDEEPNEYEFGSFIVDDEAEMSYEQ
ncbi:hypothetical protein GYMLUDRAFT_33396 [Collybiopsis luxurians FD-317 M1]|nr:hypothetical protein GYMLUDRAFT_33396 [Collybiopsis luxurians FD-317 M1]